MKGLRNYRKQKVVVAKARAKVRYFRENFRHQMSHRLIEDSQFVGVEALAVGNVTRKVKKGLDASGKPMRNGQSVERAMNRAILRSGWSGLVDRLAYKAQWYGRTFVQVDRFYPSLRLCGNCGHKCSGLRLSGREWV